MQKKKLFYIMCMYREYMGAERYGNSLQVFNSKSHKWAQRTSDRLSWIQEENSGSPSNDVLVCFWYKHVTNKKKPT